MNAMLKPDIYIAQALERQLRQFIGRPNFPCVGAKSAIGKGQLDVMVCRSISSAWDDLAIAERLIDLAHHWKRHPRLFTSMAVIFEGPRHLDEQQFERALWTRAQSLSDKDRWMGQNWDRRVASDPANPHFSLSFGGEGFFIVGLHPHASRKARRFVAPTLVFNLHNQFEQLRAANRYEKLRSTILERDRQLQGGINPMLARHGETSEARQYSGRIVPPGWQCPFRYKGDLADADTHGGATIWPNA